MNRIFKNWILLILSILSEHRPKSRNSRSCFETNRPGTDTFTPFNKISLH